MRDLRLGQEASPLLIPKEAWTDLGGGGSTPYCDADDDLGGLETGLRPGDVRGGRDGGVWLLSRNDGGVDQRLGPLPPPRGGGGRETATASPSSPSDVTTVSTTSSETYASKSTGSSASSSRSVGLRTARKRP